MMQYGEEWDLQDIENHLYNQVYHSFVDWDKEQQRTPNQETLNAGVRIPCYNSQTPSRRRYWRHNFDEGNSSNQEGRMNDAENFHRSPGTEPEELNPRNVRPPNVRPAILRPPNRSGNNVRNGNVREENGQPQNVAPQDAGAQNARQPNGKPPRKDKQKRKERRKFSKKKQPHHIRFAQNNDVLIYPTLTPEFTNYSQTEQCPPQVNNVPPQVNNVPPPEAANPDVVVLDSDSDSVEEIPLPPIPTYSIDSSDEEELQQPPKEPSPSLLKTEENEADKNITSTQENPKETQNTTQENLKDVETQLSKENPPKSIAQQCHTDLSNPNDFIQKDIDHLNKDDPQFNFNLHEYDLGNMDNEFLRPVTKQSTSAPVTDLYETESSCSELGNPQETAAVFPEVTFDTHVNVIFEEPDLASFSNFITPNRSRPKLTQTNNQEETALEPCRTLQRKDESDTNEYESDPNVSSAKKKRKRKKRKRAIDKSQNEPIVDIAVSVEFQMNCPNNNDRITQPQNVNQQSETTQLSLEANQQVTMETCQQVQTSCKEDPPMLFVDDLNQSNTSLVNASNETNDDDEFIDICSTNTENITASTSTTTTTTCQQFSFLRVFELQQKNKTVTSQQDHNQTNSLQQQEEEQDKQQDSSHESDKEIDVGVETNYVNVQQVDTSVIVLSDSDDSAGGNEVVKRPNINENLILNITPFVKNEQAETSGEFSGKDKCDNSGERMEERGFEQGECSKSRNRQSKSMKKKLVRNPFNMGKANCFSDYWTTDMEKFYDDSWGQEDYDLQKELSKMTADPAKWKIIPEDIHGIPTRQRGPRCVRCKEFGHARYECPKLAGQKCSLCGQAGHFHARCPNLMCTTCGRKGGYHTTSCSNCISYSSLRCSLCTMRGHIDRNCPDLWRRYHVTKNSNRPKISKLKLKPPDKRWCSGCAKRGHFQHECRHSSSEHFRTLPNAVNYDAIYDTVLHFNQMEPDPLVPTFRDVSLPELRNYKNSLIAKNAVRYKGFLRSLRARCQKYDISLVEHVESLQRDLRNNKFDVKKVKMMYKLNNRIKKFM